MPQTPGVPRRSPRETAPLFDWCATHCRSVFFLGGAILVTQLTTDRGPKKTSHKTQLTAYPPDGSTNGRVSSLLPHRRRQMTASRNARFMLVAAMCVACLDVEIRAQKATLSAAELTTPTMLPQTSINV
jgi:hypothetical protein